MLLETKEGNEHLYMENRPLLIRRAVTFVKRSERIEFVRLEDEISVESCAAYSTTAIAHAEMRNSGHNVEVNATM